MAEQLWSDDLLERPRQQCDPLADEAVSGLFQNGQVPAANTLMKQLVANEQVLPEQLPAGLRGYFEQSGRLPPWVDLGLLRKGEELFGRYGPQIVLSLLCSSLPSCYAAAKGVQVLHLTARLETDPYRRILETSQMIIDVMAPGGLESGGLGLRSAQKVRLMHAAVRHLIRRSGQWNAEWGQPINQEDMAGTLLTFSSLILQSLKRMGCDFTPVESQAYYHAWRVVGFVMGLDERLMPTSAEEGERLMATIQIRHYRASAEGQAMTRALLEMMQHMLPGNAFDGMPATLTRYLVGDTTADLLGVPPSDWERITVGPLRMLGWVVDKKVDMKPPVVAKLVSLVGRRMLDGLVWINRGPERLPFRIPSALRESWGVQGWERA
ncbi:oxygenase MpaB family protein [Hyalangium rubrum]|uniref:Oxygenase MpaB family protein n=1 Tax=Hyalangium rubrum TaxID=3103134 RepID=A0ABU5HB93_9BACT|nr:oxygenase MpaB family protein [Hyalangium sp. s54d21]MDY7230098.1 oxygenase MpaB family protein [Hyalangium sp. s54d21]